MKTGAELIADERKRQVEVEGWSQEHDNQHDPMEFIRAAKAYLMIDTDYITRVGMWPWTGGSFKPKDTIKDLIRAGALIAAAIDRINESNKN